MNTPELKEVLINFWTEPDQTSLVNGKFLGYKYINPTTNEIITDYEKLPFSFMKSFKIKRIIKKIQKEIGHKWNIIYKI